MKKIAVAVALSLMAGSAAAAVTGDQFSVQGALAAGFYTDSAKEREVFNGGATGADLFVNYANDNWVAKYGVEFDLENDYGVTDSTFTDKDLWIGYKTQLGLATVGYINDTALDAVDGAGDRTIELMNSPSDASDANMIVKLEGGEGFTYGISYYLDRNQSKNSNENMEKQSGFNGYVGFSTPMFNINAGYELNDDGIKGEDAQKAIESVYLVNGTVHLGELSVGATYSESETIGGVSQEVYNVSAGYQISKLYVAGGYSNTEDSAEYVNLGASYPVADNIDVLVDVAYHIADVGSREEGDVQSFVKTVYSF